MRQAEQAAVDVRRGRARRARQRHSLRVDAMDGEPRRHVVKDPENGDYTVTFNSPQNKATLDQFIEVTKKCGVPNPGVDRTGRRHPAACHRQGAAGPARRGGVGQPAGPEEVGGRRQDRRRADSARGRRQVRRGDRQLELRDSKGISAGAQEGGARVREVVHDLRRAIRVRQGRRHSQSQRRAGVRPRQGPGYALDAGVSRNA